ncbi:hypothetical protein LEP1GSC045_4129 [Leptospira interrogans serovar Pomona str. Kennewicki LC82-25]|nr:hypothetical protein LEP1GSC045_4129 [Leptospira interrogans serovar Pomona str. Kennewicki LC82-25]
MWEFPHFQDLTVKLRFVGVPTLSRSICKITICGSSHVFQDLSVKLRFVGVPTLSRSN